MFHHSLNQLSSLLPAFTKEITLEELEDKFGLQLSSDSQFFWEWQQQLPPLTETEKQALDRIKSNYSYLSKRRPMLEEAVKMVVLSPLLDLAGFYQFPFAIETETSIDITAEDEGIIVKGNIDVLIIKKRLWVLVIESKSTRFDVTAALSQTLAYMLASPNQDNSIFGLIVNGREFLFIKLQPGLKPGETHLNLFDKRQDICR